MRANLILVSGVAAIVGIAASAGIAWAQEPERARGPRLASQTDGGDASRPNAAASLRT
jgi:hypothetical protein